MPANNNWKLVLASASPRRKELLGHTGAPFVIKVVPTEEKSLAKNPRDFVLDVARQKGVAVCEHLAATSHVVVSSDTIVALGNTIYGKPTDQSDAKRILRELSGKQHEVHTAVCIHVSMQNQWRVVEFVETTKVEFIHLSDDMIAQYVASGDPMDKAGAYGIQGGAQAFVARIEGSYTSVVGFPLAQFCAKMEQEFCSLIGGPGPWQKYFI